MADPKKNPLLGAFRVSPPADKPPTGATDTPLKPTMEKASTEVLKETVRIKDDTPPWEDKAKGDKTHASPGKSGEEKKPAEPPKVPEGEKPDDRGKEIKDGKTPAAFDKLSEEKKPTEPPNALAGQKPDSKGKVPKGDKATAAPGKPGEEKKATNPPKAPEGEKPIDKSKEAPKSDKAPSSPTEPGEKKASADPPKEAEELDKDGIPKDFSMQIVPQNNLGKVIIMPIAYIDDFENHPFPVRDDEDMDALVESIKQVGILEPTTIIPNRKETGRFEMVAGHRRKRGAILAGLDAIPVIIRDMDHDEATIYMVDSNLKREKPLTPMEKARAYTMRAEALRRKSGRRSKAEIAALEASGKKPLTADEEIAKQTGESVAQVQRLKTLTKLTPPLQKMVDDKKLPVNTAVDIAQMKPKEQEKLADAIEKEGGTIPSGTKAKELKEASKAGTLTEKKIEEAVAPTKREIEPPLKVTLMEEDLLPYFPKGTTVPDVKKGIFEGLEVRKKLIERQKAKAKEENGGKNKPPSPAR